MDFLDYIDLPDETKTAIRQILHPSDLKSQIQFSDIPEDKKKAVLKVIDEGNEPAIKIVRQFLQEKKAKENAS